MPFLADSLLPQVHKVLHALHELCTALGLALDDACLRAGRCHIGPACQLSSVLKRKIKEGRQHHGGELNRDRINPIKFFIERNLIEHGLRSLADHL